MFSAYPSQDEASGTLSAVPFGANYRDEAESRFFSDRKCLMHSIAEQRGPTPNNGVSSS